MALDQNELMETILDLQRRVAFLETLEVHKAGESVYTWIPAQGLRAPGIKPATYVDHGISGAWRFADNQEEIVVANMKVPDGMNLAQPSSLCLGWSSTVLGLNCDWEVAYLITALNEDTTAAADATVQHFAASSAVAEGLVITNFAIAGGVIGVADVCLHINVMRDGNDVLDTLGAAAELHGMAFSYVRY